MPLLDSDGHIVDLHFDAALCPECGLTGLHLTSAHVAEEKWRAVYEFPVCEITWYFIDPVWIGVALDVYECPVCEITWYSFKGEKMRYAPDDFDE